MSYSSKSTKPARRHLLRAGALAGALAVTLSLGACSTEDPAPETSAAAEAGSSIPTAGTVKTSFGKYRQSTVTESDPAWELPDEAVGSDVLAEYSRDEVTDAYRFALTFAAEEGIDSPLNGEGVSVDDWWGDHKGDFHPDNRPEMLTSLEQGKSVVQREPWQTKDYEGYSYIYDSGPRVVERTITPDAAWLAADGGIAFRMNVNYTMRVTPGIGEAGDGRQVTNGYLTYSVREDGPGDWAITSFLHDLRTFPG
ncbi:hypothetical protein [Arthrobacter sp. zg-Y1110]|uniref:hypothetical protein n=1 Tax=Arthrobacter sp. zg-Y1110 TaxID=2886932 RepID=UPI001D15CE55|nr:hypothetical protein [Arthrobacter sp. zg-Y1110]MCC3292909.1 hypothetical protein [Arthrobacter sp. zg-Y1110]UWX86848.1 hypothetical protein N2K99_18570 [Arthrobacter sp. zg-Y1110]